MQYKTIVRRTSERTDRSCTTATPDRRPPSDDETCARELKASHETWMETLAQANPGSDPSQISSEAMELALRELEDRLPSVHPRKTGNRFRSTRRWHSSAVNTSKR